MKKQRSKGITLIALVITIIIMIILVAVSVALVVKGDLFGNAQDGTEQTRIEAEKEQLTEYVYGQYRQNEATKKVEVNLDKVKEILEGDTDKFNGDAKIEGDKLIVTGNSGVVYTVYKDGKIGDEIGGNINPPGNPDKLTLEDLMQEDKLYCYSSYKEGEGWFTRYYVYDSANSRILQGCVYENLKDSETPRVVNIDTTGKDAELELGNYKVYDLGNENDQVAILKDLEAPSIQAVYDNFRF